MLPLRLTRTLRLNSFVKMLGFASHFAKSENVIPKKQLKKSFDPLVYTSCLTTLSLRSARLLEIPKHVHSHPQPLHFPLPPPRRNIHSDVPVLFSASLLFKMPGMNLRGREDELFPPRGIYKFFMARGFR